MQKRIWTITNPVKCDTEVTNKEASLISIKTFVYLFHLQEAMTQRSPLNDSKKHQLCLDKDCSACLITE